MAHLSQDVNKKKTGLYKMYYVKLAVSASVRQEMDVIGKSVANATFGFTNFAQSPV